MRRINFGEILPADPRGIYFRWSQRVSGGIWRSQERFKGYHENSGAFPKDPRWFQEYREVSELFNVVPGLYRTVSEDSRGVLGSLRNSSEGFRGFQGPSEVSTSVSKGSQTI